MNLELLKRVRDAIDASQTFDMTAWSRDGATMTVDEDTDRPQWSGSTIQNVSTLARRELMARYHDDVKPVGCNTPACIAGYAAAIVINDQLDALPDLESMEAWVSSGIYSSPDGDQYTEIGQFAAEQLCLTGKQWRRLFFTSDSSIWAHLFDLDDLTIDNEVEPTAAEAVELLDMILANPSIL
jgi:hypothetical protein